jgi:C_GCAxxG_C_C family probable redox protein
MSGVKDEDRTEVRRRALAEARRLHDTGLNCAESVLGGVVGAFGGRVPLRIATGFGGGLGRTGEVCGAVSGAVMAVGWLAGRDGPEDRESYSRCSAAVREFLGQFRRAQGSLLCRELTGYDLSDPAILPVFAADQARREKCGAIVATAADLAADLVGALAAHTGQEAPRR